MLNIETQIFQHELPVRGTFMGLDLSLTSSGIGILMPGEFRSYRLKTANLRGLHRLKSIADHIALRALELQPLATVIEGYSFSSMHSHAHALGELGGIVKLSLAVGGHQTFTAPPTTVKKIITGKGNCKGKGPIMLALFKQFGLEISQDDQADGAALACIAGMVHGGFTPRLTKDQAAGLTKVERVDSPFPTVRHRTRPTPANDGVELKLQPVAKNG